MKRYFVTIVFLWILIPLFSQEEKDSVSVIGVPSDMLYWQNEKYLINKSFFYPLKGNEYRDIYTQDVPFECVFIVEPYMGGDAVGGFRPLWLLQDSVLYLRELDFLADTAEYLPKQKQYRMMEEFTGQKFKRNKPLFTQLDPKESIAGSMKATWVNGAFLLKKARVENEDIFLWEKKKEYYKFTFKDGKLISVETIKPTVESKEK